MKKSVRIIRNTLRGFTILALLLYTQFLIEEDVPLLKAGSFADTSVYLLFLIFVLGVGFLWRHELISGIILVVWYGFQWILVFWTWDDGELTLILGLPIGLLGILITAYALWQRKSSKPEGQPPSH